MEWMRRYGGWLVLALSAVAVAVQFYVTTQPSESDRRMNELMAEGLRMGQEQQEQLLMYSPFADDKFRSDEKGDDSDTIFITAYDSLAASLPYGAQQLRVKERADELRNRKLELSYLRRLQGTWELAAYDDPKTKTRSFKKTTLVFDTDSTFSYTRKGEHKQGGFFIFARENSTVTFGTVSHDDCPKDHRALQRIRISNDSLFFERVEGTDFPEFIYVKK